MPVSVRSTIELVKVSVMAYLKPGASVGASFQNVICSTSAKATKSGSGKVPKIRDSMTCLLEHDPHCHTGGVLRMSLVPGFTVSTIILHFLQVGVATSITGSMTPAVVKIFARVEMSTSAALFEFMSGWPMSEAGRAWHSMSVAGDTHSTTSA